MTQHNLFTDAEAGSPVVGTMSGLFADIFFDRPLDHAYSYAVPEELRNGLEVGKRVQVPFGRGDKGTIGYCVGLNETTPARAVKAIQKVLDEEALLTPELLRLTRWMADYYLCGWGQVLNAVVPAGARDRAGTRSAAFVEAVPESDLPDPLPSLSTKQKAVLDKLRPAGKPLEPRRLARLAECGQVPIEALVDKGLARRVARRVDKFEVQPEDDDKSEGPISLNPDQLVVSSPIEH